jgi:ABC-type sulfate transport system permease component
MVSGAPLVAHHCAALVLDAGDSVDDAARTLGASPHRVEHVVLVFLEGRHDR